MKPIYNQNIIDLIKNYYQSRCTDGEDWRTLLKEEIDALNFHRSQFEFINIKNACEQLINGGCFAISYWDVLRDLKEIYGENFTLKPYIKASKLNKYTVDNINIISCDDFKVRQNHSYCWVVYKQLLIDELYKLYVCGGLEVKEKHEK